MIHHYKCDVCGFPLDTGYDNTKGDTLRVSPCKQCEAQREVRFSRILAQVRKEVPFPESAEIRETFDTGAVRNKTDYRYDLMSPIVVKEYVDGEERLALAQFLLSLHEVGWYDDFSVDLSLLLDDVVRPVSTEYTTPHLYAQALHEGALKYGDRNWEKGIPEKNLVNHALHHLFKLAEGDTSENHLSHLVWNVMTIIHFREQHKKDD